LSALTKILPKPTSLPIARHAERVRSSSADLLERHGSPLFVVVHDDKIVAICHSEDEAHDLGEDSYRFEEFTVHGLSTEPKQIVGLTRR